MSDHAATIREILTRHASFPFTNGDARAEALAALDALVAERDEARREFVQIPTTAQILRAEEAKAERDHANVEWHRIRGLHAAAIADLRVVVAERDAALADLADERNDSVQDKDYIVQLKAEIARLLQEQRYLLAEVDCRIEHGAESNGHLEYVRTYLGATKARRGEAK